MTTQTFTIYKDSIPAACYEAEKRVRARISGITGVDTVDMEIVSITSGSGETDTVSMTYDTADTGGVVLTNCNIAAFMCVADCCQTSLCLSGWMDQTFVDGGIPDGTINFGVLPRDMLVDSILLALPNAFANGDSDRRVSVSLRAGFDSHYILTNVQLSEDPYFGTQFVRIHRADFDLFYASGLLPQGWIVGVDFTDASTGTVLPPHGPLQICFNGKYLP